MDLTEQWESEIRVKSKKAAQAVKYMWNFESESNDVEKSKRIETDVGGKWNELREVSPGNKKSTERNMRRKKCVVEEDEPKQLQAVKEQQVEEAFVATTCNDQMFHTKGNTSCIPSLFECANLLKEKVVVICVDNRLFYFNGRCYEPLDITSLVMLYRDKVDNKVHGARNMKMFHDLYAYLLTDSEIQKKLNLCKLSNIAVLNNGIYNVKKDRFERYDPNVMAFSYVDAAYVENTECPVFEKFLRDVTGNDSILIERMWRFLGYIFTQSLDAKVFFVMGHAPNSGKSLLGKFIQRMYESRYVSSVALSDFNGNFSMGTIVGAAVNISLDLPKSRLGEAAVSKLKMLTGGDLITVNEKYVPQFKYQNRAKFIFASNHPIQLMEDDEAFWERLIFLPFDYSIDKMYQDTNLLKKMLKEKDAVVSKALQYARKLVQDNYTFPTTDDIERRIRRWRGIEIDTVNDFLLDRCFIGENYQGEFIADLYEAYKQFCSEIEEAPQSKLEMEHYLQHQVGLERKKVRLGKVDNPRYAFIGIALKSADE